MDATGLVQLAGRNAAALGRIGLDALAEPLGGALPRTPEQIARPQALNALFAAHTPAGQERLPRVVAARLPGVHFESSNCTNFLVELEFEGGPRPDLPRTLYVKLPCRELGTRAFANALGFWSTERLFCERVAAKLPIRVPRVHAAAERGARFALVLEDLGTLPGIRLFVNRDMAAGTDLARARMCLETFAELHAHFWGWSRAQRDQLVPPEIHTYLAPRNFATTRALNAIAIAGARRRAPDLFPAEIARACQRATDHWDAVLRAWYREPLTLIHGDSHLANCFEYASDDGPRMGMLDFQAFHWSQGVRDVQYFLINSIAPGLLALHEQELLAHYVEALARRGVALELADAREQYRAFSFQTLMVSVVPLGLGALTEREATVKTLLRRGVAALERLDFAGWLERVIAAR